MKNAIQKGRDNAPKSPLEIAKFKIEMAIFLLRCDRIDDADRLWQEGINLLEQEIKNQKEVA